MKLIVYILIIQFSLGSMIPNTDFSQMSKISFLIEHFQIHKKEAVENSESFDVLDFVYLHYITPDEHMHESPVDHDELPLKNINSNTLIIDDFTIDNESVSNLPFFKAKYSLDVLSDRLLNKSQFHPPSIV